MATRGNAQLAVVEYHRLRNLHGYSQSEAWKGIAELLFTCQVQHGGSWSPFHGVIVFRESNDFKLLRRGGPNATLRQAEQLSQFMANELGCSREDLCSRIGAYWRHQWITQKQQHNLVGNAFRSITAEILSYYGAATISYEEEVLARKLFPGWPLRSRSTVPKIDIVAFKGPLPVAMISTRWRYRHDRVDFIDEAHAYTAAGSRMFDGIPYYAVTAEFSPARLRKVLDNAPPTSNGPITAGVHLAPALISHGLGLSGGLGSLKSLDWLISQTHSW